MTEPAVAVGHRYLAGMTDTVDRLRLERTDLLYAWDTEGNRFLDYTAGGGLLPLGWHHKISEALWAFHHSPPPTGMMHAGAWGETLSFVQAEYAELLSARFPLVDGEPMKVLMTSSGAEARALLPELMSSSQPFSYVQALDPDTCIAPEPKTWAEIPEHVMVVMDERFTGFGRTGTFCAREQMPYLKDLDPARLITVLGDAGGCGIPWGAVVAPAAVFEHLKPTRRLGGNPLACAAGRELLTLMDGPFMEHAHDMAHDLNDALVNLQRNWPVIGGLTGKGLARGMVLRDHAAARAVHREALAQGLILNLNRRTDVDGKVLTMTPPLIITELSLREGFDKLTAAMIDADNKGYL